MKPTKLEQRIAQELLEELRGSRASIIDEYAIDLIAAALHAHAEAERERCARIADSESAAEGGMDSWAAVARRIAAAIRGKDRMSEPTTAVEKEFRTALKQILADQIAHLAMHAGCQCVLWASFDHAGHLFTRVSHLK